MKKIEDNISGGDKRRKSARRQRRIKIIERQRIKYRKKQMAEA